MKRKFIQDLLADRDHSDLQRRIAKVIPGTTKRESDARQILEDTVEVFQATGLLDPVRMYHAVCNSSASQIAEQMQGRPSGILDELAVESAQIVLKDVLTSKAGPKKSSGLSRSEQLAASQARFRDKIKGDKKRLDVWITQAAASQLEEIQNRLGCETKSQTVEFILDAAVRGVLLTPPHV